MFSSSITSGSQLKIEAGPAEFRVFSMACFTISSNRMNSSSSILLGE
jgi:hypothetical protein